MSIRKRFRRWVLVMLVAASGTACDAQGMVDGAQSGASAGQGRVIVIPEGWTEPFDALPGDRLDVLMVADGGQVERCDDMGGELIYDPRRLTWTCEGVDY